MGESDLSLTNTTLISFIVFVQTKNKRKRKENENCKKQNYSYFDCSISDANYYGYIYLGCFAYC